LDPAGSIRRRVRGGDDAPDQARVRLGEPEIPVRARGDVEDADAGGRGNVSIAPFVVMRPMLSLAVNQSAPSAPTAISPGNGVTGNPAVSPRECALAFPAASVNQSAPSGPETMSVGFANAVARFLVRTLPAASMRLTLDGFWLTNHIAPSLPAVMSYGKDVGGTGA
jgi:hypothetical protein